MPPSPDQPVRLLVIEDVPADAERMLHQFHRAGVPFQARCIDTPEALAGALADFAPHVVLSDYTMPAFDGMAALAICRERAPGVPFVFVSGTIGEERAVAALQAGAADYVLKENLQRLVPAAQRAIAEARARAERAAQQAQIARLNRVLRMLKGVNEMVMRCRDRVELLSETCRLAISLGGYAMAVAAARTTEGAAIKAVAANGLDEAKTAGLRTYLEEAGSHGAAVLASVLRSGEPWICNDLAALDGTGRFDALMMHTGLRAFVVLPLLVDGVPAAALMLTARDPGVLAAEELDMLRDLAHSLSFGLQYVQRDAHVRFLANFHPQTGLARRALFCSRVRELLARTQAEEVGHAVAVIDVRGLCAINDTYGRSTGDQLLRHVAEALKRQYRHVDHLGHFGGGTFAVVLEKPSGSAHAWQAIIPQLASDAVVEPLVLQGRRIPVAVRVGCALHPHDAGDATELVQHAETALLFARAEGAPGARFNPAMKRRSVGNLELEHRLRFALERNEFELHYQPKVNVVTRRVQGAEALLRWRSPEEGLVMPENFLPVLESSGLIVDVGHWVVRKAALDCARWKRDGLPPVRVAVNIAPAHLRLPAFENDFMAEVGDWGNRYWGLDIEITEGMLQEDSGAEIRKLERLRMQGVRISIDDFGTGYSSLSRLAELPVDTLKIDRRFISQIVRNPTGATVVKTVVSLARAFNMTSVAEGVEQQEQLDQLWHVGCDQSQGYLHCPPLPADQFFEVVRKGRGVLMQPPEPEPDPDEAGEAATGCPAPAR
ncbi:MAG: EAL domain-containing protein [Pseudomonadota bacterium]|jgi:diguanylate cyclase (GGDEF)-like protein|nr:MAG: hypothetical protein DIU62_10425 [Pseudomonadota bacterium]